MTGMKVRDQNYQKVKFQSKQYDNFLIKTATMFTLGIIYNILISDCQIRSFCNTIGLPRNLNNS